MRAAAIAFEAIDHQHGGELFHSMTAFIEQARSLKSASVEQYNRHIKQKLNRLIFKKTGINANVHMDKSFGHFAYVLIPDIDRNHPLFSDARRTFFESKYGLEWVKKNGGVIEGEVNLKKGYVKGDFQKVEFNITLSRLFLTPRFYTAEETAAIILHELGHCFTYFEYLGTHLTTNYVLQHVSRTLMNTTDKRKRYKVIEEGSEVLGVNIDDPEALLYEEDEKVIQAVLLTQVMKNQQHELGSSSYDLTAWEMLSDQFATRQGAGRALVTALDKLFRSSGYSLSSSTMGYCLNEVFKFLFFVATIPLTLGIIQFFMLFVVDANDDLYDKPKDRMLRVRRDMIQALKNQDLSREYRKQLDHDIKMMDEVIQNITQRDTLLELYWQTVHPRGRYHANQKAFQQQLERLVHNDLYLKANALALKSS